MKEKSVAMNMNLQHLLLLSFYFISVSQGQDTLTFNLLEEQPSNTLVGDIAASSQLSSTLTDQEFRSLRYTLVDQGSIVNTNIFSLDKTSGRLTTVSVIDRETVCGISTTCDIEFGVAINSEKFTNIYRFFNVKVILKDINDNVPSFSSNIKTIQIPENTGVGYQKTIESATDRDVGINGIQSYEIVPSNGTFGLNVTKKRDGSFSVKIQLMRPVDREVQGFYQFHIMAKDGGIPPNIGTLTVDVQILDINDHAPEFLLTSYKVNVNESIAMDSIILQCSAQDRDIGKNGLISYAFSPYQPEINLIKQTFSIDQQGYIRVISPLNYGIRKTYTFYVDASDGGDEVKTTQMDVTVNVLDTGNNKPIVNIKYLRASENDTVNVSESSSLELAIAHISIQDSDTGRNGMVSCVIQDPVFGLQNVSDNMKVVVLKRTLDREARPVHNVTVSCSDKGVPPLTTSKHFRVRVMDENDHRPVFSKAYYHASIEENLSIGRVISQVSATDDDIGHNALIRYYIENGSDGSKFTINDNSGVITSGITYDREVQAQMTFRVLAIDSGNPKLTGTATVVVNITDDNDNAPRFNVSHFQLYIMEGLKPDSTVGKITATDLDEGKNAQITYSISESADPNLPFHMYSDGRINTTATLDREFKDEYTFTIYAYDQGLPMQSSSAKVTVIVADANDNNPVVVFPNDTNDTATISYLAPVGSYITTVKAYDRDSPINSQLNFKIIRGNEHDIFDLDQHSGELIMINTFLIKEDTTFVLDIAATDSGRPPRTEMCKLRIVLKYTNNTVKPQPKEPNKFIVISVIVVVFTVLVSAIILTIIFLLRRSDRKRAKEIEKQHHDQLYGELDKNFYQNGDLSYVNADLRKKKKEVSFSLDDDLDKSLDISSSSMLVDLGKTQNAQYHPYQNSVVQEQDHFKHQFHQFLINPDRQPSDNKQIKSTHDSTSDTSTEMTTSDSGHGSSDMEAPSSGNLHDDEKNYPEYNRSASYPPLQSTSIFDRGNNSSKTHCTDIYSISSKHKEYSGLTPRETFERKHGLTSSVRRDSERVRNDRPKSESCSPSYV